jgi:uncharacterized membrane protein
MEQARHPALERLLAQVLRYGTWLGSLVVTTGLILVWLVPVANMGTRITMMGIALFILLPIARVFLMLVAFLRERDNRFAAIAAVVLAIIAAGAAVGALLTGSLPG